jgi:hypothetical protein
MLVFALPILAPLPPGSNFVLGLPLLAITGTVDARPQHLVASRHDRAQAGAARRLRARSSARLPIASNGSRNT